VNFRNSTPRVEAIEDLKKARHGDVTVYSPTIRGTRSTKRSTRPTVVVRRFTLIGGLLGVSFGYWVAVWTSSTGRWSGGRQGDRELDPLHDHRFEVMVLVGCLSTVAGMFINARIPRLTTTVGYDPRFSGGHFGIFVSCSADKAAQVEALLQKHGAEEVRREA
jgi:hypothetical protein